MKPINVFSIRKIVAGFTALLIAVSLAYSEEQGIRGGPSPRQQAQPKNVPHAAQPARQVQKPPMPAVAQRPAAPVERFSHGTIRHIDTHMYRPPVAVNQQQRRPQNPAQMHPRPDFRGGVANVHPRNNAIVYHDVDVDTHHSQHWRHFAYGERSRFLRPGNMEIFINTTPYFYDDGIYYQQQAVDNTYQEVYPPIGAVVQTLPDGSIEVDAQDGAYFYAGGAFYVQNDNGFEIVAAPIGVVVPELPPGATQATVNGNLMYQFNGVFYQPIFENGITQYITTAG